MTETDIERLRRHIDDIDSRIVHLLADRAERTEQIQILKRLAGLPPRSPDRENDIMEHLTALARSRGLDPELVRFLFSRIIDGSSAARPEGDRRREAIA